MNMTEGDTAFYNPFPCSRLWCRVVVVATVMANWIVRKLAVQEFSNSLTLSVKQARVSFCCSKVVIGCGVRGHEVPKRIQTLRGSDCVLLLCIIPRYILSFGILCICGNNATRDINMRQMNKEIPTSCV
jgi:hypothetical protein